MTFPVVLAQIGADPLALAGALAASVHLHLFWHNHRFALLEKRVALLEKRP